MNENIIAHIHTDSMCIQDVRTIHIQHTLHMHTYTYKIEHIQYWYSNHTHVQYLLTLYTHLNNISPHIRIHVHIELVHIVQTHTMYVYNAYILYVQYTLPSTVHIVCMHVHVL